MVALFYFVSSKFGGLIRRIGSFNGWGSMPCLDTVLTKISPNIAATPNIAAIPNDGGKTKLPPGRSFDLCRFLLSQSDLCSFVFYSALQTFASKYVAQLHELAMFLLIKRRIPPQKCFPTKTNIFEVWCQLLPSAFLITQMEVTIHP